MPSFFQQSDFSIWRGVIRKFDIFVIFFTAQPDFDKRLIYLMQMISSEVILCNIADHCYLMDGNYKRGTTIQHHR